MDGLLLSLLSKQSLGQGLWGQGPEAATPPRWGRRAQAGGTHCKAKAKDERSGRAGLDVPPLARGHGLLAQGANQAKVG